MALLVLGDSATVPAAVWTAYHTTFRALGLRLLGEGIGVWLGDVCVWDVVDHAVNGIQCLLYLAISGFRCLRCHSSIIARNALKRKQMFVFCALPDLD
jgi:hypothetical protein